MKIIIAEDNKDPRYLVAYITIFKYIKVKINKLDMKIKLPHGEQLKYVFKNGKVEKRNKLQTPLNLRPQKQLTRIVAVGGGVIGFFPWIE